MSEVQHYKISCPSGSALLLNDASSVLIFKWNATDVDCFYIFSNVIEHFRLYKSCFKVEVENS